MNVNIIFNPIARRLQDNVILVLLKKNMVVPCSFMHSTKVIVFRVNKLKTKLVEKQLWKAQLPNIKACLQMHLPVMLNYKGTQMLNMSLEKFKLKSNRTYWHTNIFCYIFAWIQNVMVNGYVLRGSSSAKLDGGRVYICWSLNIHMQKIRKWK